MHQSSNRASRLALLSVAAFAFVLTAARLPNARNVPSSPGALAKSFVIRNVRIFDGEKLLPAADVSVENGLIKAVGKNLKVALAPKKSTALATRSSPA